MYPLLDPGDVNRTSSCELPILDARSCPCTAPCSPCPSTPSGAGTEAFGQCCFNTGQGNVVAANVCSCKAQSAI